MSDSQSSHTIGMDNMPVSFMTLSYIHMLSLGQLDMVGIRQLCVLEFKVLVPLCYPSG